MEEKTDTDKDGTSEGTADTLSMFRPALSLLKRRSFNACRGFTRKIVRSDPNTSLQIDQILAVADVLAAAERRHDPLDWYSILRLSPGDATADRDFVRQQFKILVRLLDPNKNKFPFADEALMRVREAWCVLSDPTLKASFDRKVQEEASSFWTMCPYCWYLHEYQRCYEDCSLRCANCQKTFHGTAVKPPPPESVVAGKEEYYCYHVSFPLRYPVGEENGMRKRFRVKTVAHRTRTRTKGVVHELADSDSDGEEKDKGK
ncbi:uncharacterized protein At4g38065 [Vigna radiata var. radiata]|uniref:Uncharacterized protein At4g38065 n=1 Tax=Vigna radiata var. radiata TaxID=3916 RepID=A0A1S3TG54_VIGRR|nr:uncharacterized protein At4g38065 [Vigna radiata var. radiata]